MENDNDIAPGTGPLSISDWTASCSNLFQEILSGIEVNTTDFDLVETQFGRLSIWAGNVGVFADSKASLDYRLRYSDNIKSMVVQLLGVLDRNLRQVINPKLHGRLVTKKDNEPGGDYWSQYFTEAVDATSASIDRLQTLAIVIRKSSAQSRNLKARDFFTDNDENFESFALSLLRHRFKEANGSLCEQLAASIALRRRRFEYNAKHQKKLTFNATLNAQDTGVQYKASFSTGQIQASTPLKPNNPTIIKEPVIQPAPSQTKASTVDTKAFHNLRRQYQPEPSIVSKGTSVRDPEQEYPPPPRAEPKQIECTCPYCCELIPAARVGNDQWWKSHVDKDLEPFVCISERCKTAEAQFSKLDDWVQHMNEHGPSSQAWNVHSRLWQCPACDTCELFRWEQEFMDHLRSCHAKRFTQSQLSTLARRSTVSATRDPFTCPLCNCMPEEISQIPPQNREKMEFLLPRHIAGHLKSLAFLSLPYRDDISDNLSELSRDPSRAAQLEEMQAVSEYSSSDGVSWTYSDNGPNEEVPSPVDTDSSWDFLPIASYEVANDSIIRDIIALKTKDIYTLASNGILREQDLVSLDHNEIDTVHSHSRFTPLCAAVWRGDISIVELLLRYGANCNGAPNSRPPLWVAATTPSRNAASLIQLLLTHGADPNLPSPLEEDEKSTPLFATVRRSHRPDVLKALIDAGASPMVPNDIGETAVTVAIGDNDREGLRILLDGLGWTTEDSVVDKFIDITSYINKNSFGPFFPPDSSFLKTMIQRAIALESDPENHLDVKSLARLSLYQLVLYCDDSNSMRMNNRKEQLHNLIQHINSITTRITPDNEGVELRFINHPVEPRMSNPSSEIIHEIMSSVRFDGWTEIGINFRDKILHPLLYKQLRNKPLNRPILVFIITVGYPEGPYKSSEELGTLPEAIVQCTESFERLAYDGKVVRFQISQIGEDEKGTEFLSSLKNRRECKDVLYCTPERLNDKLTELQNHQAGLEQWLLDLLMRGISNTEPVSFRRNSF